MIAKKGKEAGDAYGGEKGRMLLRQGGNQEKTGNWSEWIEWSEKDEKRMEKENDCFAGEGRNRRFSPSRLAFSSAFSFPFSFPLFFFFVKNKKRAVYALAHP